MALATDRDEFKEYCLRKLGAPVIDINVADEQIDDRIDEALKFYQIYHNEALERTIILYELNQDDIDNGYITLPASIISVIKAASRDPNLYSNNFMNNIWVGMKNIMYDVGFGMGGCKSSMSNFHLSMQYLSDLQFMFSPRNELIFNYNTHRLQIPAMADKIKKATVGNILAFEVYQIVDPDASQSIWETPVLIEYTTALIGCQWGSNLSKYDGIQLPGGITLDGDKIYDRYNEIRLKIEDEFSTKYETPIDFFVG